MAPDAPIRLAEAFPALTRRGSGLTLVAVASSSEFHEPLGGQHGRVAGLPCSWIAARRRRRRRRQWTWVRGEARRGEARQGKARQAGAGAAEAPRLKAQGSSFPHSIPPIADPTWPPSFPRLSYYIHTFHRLITLQQSRHLAAVPTIAAYSTSHSYIAWRPFAPSQPPDSCLSAFGSRILRPFSH